MKNICFAWVLLVVAGIIAGCATPPPPTPPLKAVSVERPSGAVRLAQTPGGVTKHPRGGWYFWNFGFRPAPDVVAYLREEQAKTGGAVLQNADVECNIPFVIDILFFGYNKASDVVTQGGVQR